MTADRYTFDRHRQQQRDAQARPVSCSFCEMDLTAAEALACRRPDCPTKGSRS